jgi:RNA polymerase sigma-70 factor, ECF subfamily
LDLPNRESVTSGKKGTKEFDIFSFLVLIDQALVLGRGRCLTRFETQFDRLLTAARAGDRSALGHLLDSFRVYLSLLADRKLGADLKPKCSQSDLVQKTFLDAQQAFGQFEGSDPQKVCAWLERILLNNLGDVARQFRQSEKRQIQREVPLAESWGEISALIDRSTPSKKVASQEESDRLQQALARLSADFQRVITLRNLERRKFEEIADAMERSVGAVKKLWSRAIMQLRKEMKDDE